MKTAQRIAKNTLSLFASGLISPLIATFVVVYMARVFGPEGFGSVNFAVAIAAYFTLFAEMGLGLYGARESARDKEQINVFMGNILALRIVLAVASFIVLIIFVYFLKKPYEIKLLIILFGLGLFPSAFIVEWAYQGMERMEYIGASRIFTRLVYMVLVVCFVKSDEHIWLVPCFQLAGTILVNAALFILFITAYGLPKIHVDLSALRNIIKSALPLGLSVILIQVIYNIDTVMLGFMSGETDVGYYSAAYKLVFPFVLAIGAYFDAIYPVASKYFNTSLEKLRQIQEYSTRFMTAIAVPCAVAGLILAPGFIHIFYGDRYAQSVVVFQILICMVGVICINTLYARGLWACNKQGAYLKIVAIQAASNVILNVILIPKLGLNGAALSKIAAEAAGLIFYYREFNKVVRVPLLAHLWRPVLATTAMVFFLIGASQLHMAFLIIGSIFIYVAALGVVKGINRNDIAILKESLI